jgi:hypothetical protein
MSNGLRAVVGNLSPGEWGAATFAFEGGLSKMKKDVSLTLFSKNGRRATKVGQSDSITLVRDQAYLKVVGNPTIDRVRFIAGDSSDVRVSFPIETNAYFGAGFFGLRGFNPIAQQYTSGGSNVHDLQPGSSLLEIPIRMNVSTKVRGGQTTLSLLLDSDDLKIQGGNRRGSYKTSVAIQVEKPKFSGDTFVFENRSDRMSFTVGETAIVPVNISTRGISSDVLRAITDGDLAMSFTSSVPEVTIVESHLPLQLSPDGLNLFASVQLRASKSSTTTLEGTFLFGGDKITALSGVRNGFRRIVRFAPPTSVPSTTTTGRKSIRLNR